MSLRKIISQYKDPIAEVGTGVALGGSITAAASNKENKKLKAGLGALVGGLAAKKLGPTLRSKANLREYAAKIMNEAEAGKNLEPMEIRDDLRKQYRDKQNAFYNALESKADALNPFGFRTRLLKRSMPKDYISQKELEVLKEKQLSRDVDSVLNQESLKKYREELDNYHRSKEAILAKMNKSEQTEHLRGKDNTFVRPILELEPSDAAAHLHSNPEKVKRLIDRLSKTDTPITPEISLRRSIIVALESEAKKNSERRMAELRKRFPDRGID